MVAMFLRLLRLSGRRVGVSERLYRQRRMYSTVKARRERVVENCLRRSDAMLQALLTGFYQKHGVMMNDKELKEMEAIVNLDDTRLKGYLSKGLISPSIRNNATAITLRQFYRFWIANGQEYR
ncbi:hypothetical protein AAMO2058_000825200 [Amorphochlora amoebiformis]